MRNYDYIYRWNIESTIMIYYAGLSIEQENTRSISAREWSVCEPIFRYASTNSTAQAAVRNRQITPGRMLDNDGTKS